MAQMTKSHFDFIANILANHVKPGLDRETYDEIVSTFAYHLGHTNEKFSERLFFEACEVDDMNWSYEVDL